MAFLRLGDGITLLNDCKFSSLRLLKWIVIGILLCRMNISAVCKVLGRNVNEQFRKLNFNIFNYVIIMKTVQYQALLLPQCMKYFCSWLTSNSSHEMQLCINVLLLITFYMLIMFTKYFISTCNFFTGLFYVSLYNLTCLIHLNLFGWIVSSLMRLFLCKNVVLNSAFM